LEWGIAHRTCNCDRSLRGGSGTVSGRFGYAWNRALVYAKGGGAWADTTYNLNANNQALKLGTGSTTVMASGWVAGAGIEYALTNRWSTMSEYDHVVLGGVPVAFPTVAVISAQTIGVRQSIDVAKLGVNYKIY
jgi:outer membrane immunogenic protein